MPGNFEAVVRNFAEISERRLIAIARESSQRLIDKVQTPVAKGGRMRVDTGFLRASGQGSLSGMPTGPTRPIADSYMYDASPTVVALASMKIGDTFYFGWTAEYARFREYKDGFLATEVQNWQTIVDGVVNDAQRIK